MMALMDEISKPKRAPPGRMVSLLFVDAEHGTIVSWAVCGRTNHGDGRDEIDISELLHFAW